MNERGRQNGPVTHTQRGLFNFSKSKRFRKFNLIRKIGFLFNQTEVRLYLPFWEWFGSKQYSVWVPINRKKINIICIQLIYQHSENIPPCSSEYTGIFSSENIPYFPVKIFQCPSTSIHFYAFLYTLIQQFYKAIIIWVLSVRVVKASSRWSDGPEFKNCLWRTDVCISHPW